MTQNHWPESLLAGASFGILLIYHVHLTWVTTTAPERTALGKAHKLRRLWVRTIMVEKEDIVGIQTLRNWVMAATFLATTSIIINIAILNVTFQSATAVAISQNLNYLGSKSAHLWTVKLLLLTMTFFFAFFNFTLAIRYYNHAGFMIDIPVREDDPDTSCMAVAKVINRGARHYFLGMRGYYLAIPLTLWLFGPLWMLGGVITLTPILYRLDRTV